ncbi:MAG: CoB--CoM heterodisulfide reductase iron-sulfur subunit B family protein [Bacteroidota bacterium]
MKYLYFPGCSLKSSGRHYEESMLAVFKKLGIEVQEIDDWNCCGATNYMAMNELKAVAITARNLALAEKMIPSGEVNVIAPCNACYMGLLKTQKYLSTEEEMRNNVLTSLKAAGLHYEGRVKIRHPLDVLVNDFGLENLKKAVVRPLKDVKIVSYYGCQVSRPISEFDDPRDPMTMDQIMMTLGATALDWPLKTRCCSGSMISTIPETGLRMNYLILKEAMDRKADIVVTACPLCQFNLECFQKKISRKFSDDIKIPVAFFSQIIGLALGIDEEDLGLQRLFVKTSSVIA